MKGGGMKDENKVLSSEFGATPNQKLKTHNCCINSNLVSALTLHQSSKLKIKLHLMIIKKRRKISLRNLKKL